MASASSKSKVGRNPQWHILSPLGPARAHHVGCIIAGTIYIHGGIDRKRSTEPLNTFYRAELESEGIQHVQWQEVRAANSPALSHHVCLSMQDRYLVLIGGWNGKARVSDVWVYDTVENCWISMKTSGFPTGSGLSSHTATLLADDSILIVGREGGVRLQRRFGNTFFLTGDIHKGVFKYTDLPLGADSRSGHTTHTVGTKLYSIGGRNDKPVEIHAGHKGRNFPCTVMSHLAKLIESAPPMSKPPCGRKHHVAMSGAGVIFIHGGETFDGRSRDPVGEMFLLATKPVMTWYNLGSSPVKRAGHICCVSEHYIIIHGGEGAKGVIYADCHKLEM